MTIYGINVYYEILLNLLCSIIDKSIRIEYFENTLLSLTFTNMVKPPKNALVDFPIIINLYITAPAYL